ncbi:hypothetical protein KL950_004526 [Ogataea haglerorum]|nr:hypothetical protein KL950_004526 [Ogataea haglerorum]
MWLAGIRSLRYQGSCWARQGVPTTAAEHRVPSYLGQGRFFWRLSGRNCGSRIVADIHGGAAGCSNGCRFGTLPCRSQSRAHVGCLVKRKELQEKSGTPRCRE